MIPLAESYYNLGKYSEAREVFERIKKIDPTKYPRIDEMIESSKSLINTEMEGN
jgi:tetratricopeptide (TPR) repeat protein